MCAIVLLASCLVAARFAPVDVANVPVDRVTTNLEQQLAADPKNADVLVNLARVHAMAFANKSDRVPVVDAVRPWLGPGVPPYKQFEVRITGDVARQTAARAHLDHAIARYREALALAPDHPVAKLGLGWALIQAGDRAAAITTLRELVAEAWSRDQQPAGKTSSISGRPMHGMPYLTEEAAAYLIPLLDAVKDAQEIATLRQRARVLADRPRWITPIAVPLADGLTALEIADEDASVLFDADGSGIPKRWSWIHTNAAWLVFDRRSTGTVESALQWFGSVTFWLFWPNGYAALGVLDDNGDDEITGHELAGLALWHDRNRNGLSERGEVRPVGDWGVVALSTAYAYDATHHDEIAYSPRGIAFRDGTTRPTYDLVLRAPGR